MLNYYYRNYVLIIYEDKSLLWLKSLFLVLKIFKKLFSIYSFIKLRFLKKELSFRIINSLKFLSIINNSKSYIRRFNFFLKKKEKLYDLLIISKVREKYVFHFLNFLSFYICNYYLIYIEKIVKKK